MNLSFAPELCSIRDRVVIPGVVTTHLVSSPERAHSCIMQTKLQPLAATADSKQDCLHAGAVGMLMACSRHALPASAPHHMLRTMLRARGRKVRRLPRNLRRFSRDMECCTPLDPISCCSASVSAATSEGSCC